MATTTEKMVKFLERKVDFEAGITRFTYEDSSQVTYDLGDLPTEMVYNLALWGINEKVGNSTANFAKARDCAGARRKCQAIWDALCRGEWEVKMSAEDRAAQALAAKAELVDEAFVREYGQKSAGACAAYAAKKGTTLKVAADFLAGIGNIAARVADIQAERAKAKPMVAESADELVDTLFGA